ncbi:MAG: hypothetical protein H7Y22_11905 [Gemmatimonadaceae bacterium]|nr:hypothetical protein [Gloeobacterales cyanobacterium ES-bin-141]
MTIFLTLLAVGFVVCILGGSLAWYASERPPGWENAETPKWVKKLGVEKIRKSGVDS